MSFGPLSRKWHYWVSARIWKSPRRFIEKFLLSDDAVELSQGYMQNFSARSGGKGRNHTQKLRGNVLQKLLTFVFVYEFINNCGAELMHALFVAFAGYFGIVIKNLYQKYINDSTKKAVVKICVHAVEQLYKDLQGEDKYNKMVESVSEMLLEKGIAITELELKMLVEVAVGEFNKVFENGTDIPDSIETAWCRSLLNEKHQAEIISPLGVLFFVRTLFRQRTSGSEYTLMVDSRGVEPLSENPLT